MKHHFHSILTTFACVTLACPQLPAEESNTLVPTSSLVVPDGMEVTVWATSPMLHNPTNMDVDHLGRVWVAQGLNYRMFRNNDVLAEDPAGDKIVVLTDTDGDGSADKSHVFVQEPELVAPLGIAVIDNKVVVSQPPSLIVYTDVDRDAVFDPEVDTREILLEGFGGRNHDHSLHAVTTGPNGQWYFNTGNAGTHIVTDKEGTTVRVGSSYKGGAPSVTDEGPNQGNQPGLVSDDGHVYVGSVVLRVNPDGTGLRAIGHNMRNSYEECVTSFGDVFQNDNDDPPACRTTWLMEYGNLGFASDDGTRKWQAERRPGQPAAIAEWRQEDPGTIPAGDVYGNGSPTGIAFYENGALGDGWDGLLLSCEAARNVVFGYKPTPQGAGFALERFDFFKIKADAGDRASWFRPSDVTVGPDGAIYVADWYDPGVGGHRMQDPEATGTIYRIAPKGFQPVVPSLDLATTEGQIAALKSPANNVRNIGFTRLLAGGEASAPAVRALLEDPDPSIQARAVFLLAQLGDQGIAEVEKVLADGAKDPQMRVAAFRALRFVDSDLLAHAKKLASDPSPAVRREVALALRDVSEDDCLEILVELAKGYDGEDRWYLEALGTGATGKEPALYTAARQALGEPGDPASWSPAYADIAWRLHPNSAANAFRDRALSNSLPVDARTKALTALAFIPTQGAALGMVEVAESGPEDTRALASWWLHNRGGNHWAGFKELMKGLNTVPGMLKADKDYLSPALGMAIEPTYSVADVLALDGDPAKGKTTIARCIMCHQVDGVGVDFGPALDGWGAGRPREIIAGALIHPSKEIAHGFEAAEVTTKDGHTLQGFVLFDGGSMILRVNGGGEVNIPRGNIKSKSSLDTSLMMSSAQLGMTAQDVADIVAYMKEGAPKGQSQAAAPVPKANGKPKPKTQDPFRDPFVNPVDNPALPRVLILGDSISIGYTPGVRQLLDGKANVHRAPTNCRWSSFGNEQIGAWIGDSKWDAIHFNFGLWDWYGWSQEAKATPESYAASLDGIVTKLKATGATLVFATTTPPCVGPERKVEIVITEDRAKEFNNAALAVMEKHGVAINDLYAAIGDDREKYQRGSNDVHYTEEGSKLLAGKVAGVIAAALPDDKPAGKPAPQPVRKPGPTGAQGLDHVAARDLTNAPPVTWGDDTAGKKRILFIAGSTTHRHGIHEYKAGSTLLADALNASGLPVEAKVHWYGWPEDGSIFDGIDACILYADAGGNFAEDEYAFLDEKFRAGMAIMFMHYGVHPVKEVGEKYYKPWIGGYYADAFSVNPSWIADLAPKADHPVARGIESPVRVYDELYWNLDIDRGNPEVFALATAVPTPDNMVRYGSSKFWNRLAEEKLGTSQEIIWCRDPGDGARGAGFVGGHYHCNWAIDEYRQIILNTIAWVARLEVPGDGVPSKPVTKEMINQNLIRPEWPEQVELPTPDLLEQPGGTPPELGPDGRAIQKPRRR